MNMLSRLISRPFMTGVATCFSDTFEVANGGPGNFADGSIKLTVNGSDKGRMNASPAENLGAFLKRAATQYGVRTFSAYADGRKLDTSDAAKPVTGITAIEIVAKDSRGLDLIPVHEKRFIFCVDKL